MPAFNYTVSLPTFRSRILSSQLSTLYTDIKTQFDSLNALGLTIPGDVTSAAQFDALLLNSGKTGFDFAKVIRSNVALNHTGGNGTVGQVLQSLGGGNTSWLSISPTERILRTKTTNNTATTTTYAADAQLAITTLTSTVTYRWTLNATLSINNTNGFKLRVIPGSSPSSSFMYVLSPEINSAAGAPTAQGGTLVSTHALAVTPAATGTYSLWASGVFVAADANLNVEFAMNATGGGNTAALTSSTTMLTVERIS